MLVAGAWPALTTAAQPINGMGLTVDAAWLHQDAPADMPLPVRPAEGVGAGEGVVYLRVPVAPAALEDVAATSFRLRHLIDAGVEPILVFEPPGARGASAVNLGFDLDSWLAGIDRLLQACDGRPFLTQVMTRAPEGLSWELYAHMVKRVAVTIKAAAPGSRTAPAAAADLATVQAMAATGMAPYIDAVAVSSGQVDGSMLAAVRQAFPMARLWLAMEGLTDVPDYMRRAGLAYSRGVSLAWDPRPGLNMIEALRRWQTLISPATVMVPPEFRRVTAADADGPLAAEQVLEMAQPDGRRHVVVFGPVSNPVSLEVSGPRVSVAWLVDLQQGRERMGAAAEWLISGGDPGTNARSRVSLPAGDETLIVRLGRVGTGAPPSARAEVQAERGLTVEEILARHRQVQAAQDRRLETVEADVQIDFHFSVASLNQTFDVRTLNRLYQEPGRTVYEERRLYLNGALWTGKRTPDLPFVLPERVTEVPLDLRLDRSYQYRLVGMEEVDGHRNYVVAFAPSDGSTGAYRGRVWIDAEQFVKRRMDVVERSPELPVISNRIRQEFSPVRARGRDWWLLKRMSGQMVFTALGRNVVLERDLAYRDYLVNEPAFDLRLEDLYAADNTLLEETGSGFRRLERVREGPDGRQDQQILGHSGVSRLLVGVWSMGDAFDLRLPFAGINYFNFDWRGTGNQLDVAWAGPFLHVSWANPSLNGSRGILALETQVNPLHRTDKRVLAPVDDVSEERLEVSQQKFRTILGRPLGANNKLEAQFDIDYFDYRRAPETADDFTLPPDTWQGAAGLRWTFARSGWRLDAEGQVGRRERWQAWGNPDGSDYDPAHRTFERLRLTLNKNFYASRQNKAGFRLSLYKGHDLDRFSRFGIGQLGVARVPGYSGDGIRFDEGAVVDLNAGLALSSRTRLDMTLSHARIRNQEDLGPGIQHVTGASVAVNFAGPFSSLMRVRLGAGLGTSIDGVDGGGSLRVTYFRTFRRWFWQKRQSPALPETKKAPAP